MEFHKYNKSFLRLTVLGSLLAVTPFFASAQDHTGHTMDMTATSPARLVQLVRNATQQFLNVNNAPGAGYEKFLGCVSGPDHGAMGTHYVNGALVGDGLIDASKPEALIYETQPGGAMKLVGVEFIVDAATWNATHKMPPVLEGQSFQLVGSPNRYALPSFYELHVWAWRDNPNGAFVDWNNNVTCEGQ